MSAVCALLNLYGSRRRFPPRTEFVSARSLNLYPQYKVKDVRCNLLNLTPVAAAPIFSETGGLHTPGCKLCHLVEKTERIKIALSTQQEQLTMLE